jgi:hypothetical protein
LLQTFVVMNKISYSFEMVFDVKVFAKTV